MAWFPCMFISNLAFLAMAHCRLGQTERAQDYLNRLRESMTRWAKDEDSQAFLREAEALLQTQTEKHKKDQQEQQGKLHPSWKDELDAFQDEAKALLQGLTKSAAKAWRPSAGLLRLNCSACPASIAA